MQHVNGELVRAILEHKPVTFLYKGLLRTVEPHAYGLTKEGHALLSGYQTGGFSQSSDKPGWRSFSLAQVEQLTVMDYRWPETREAYNPHVDMAVLIVRAPPTPLVWEEG